MKHKQVYLWFIISLFIKPLFGEEFCSTEVGNRDFRIPSIGNVKSLVVYIKFEVDTYDHTLWPLTTQNTSDLNSLYSNLINESEEFENQQNLTTFFWENSFGQLNIYGDIYPEVVTIPINGSPITSTILTLDDNLNLDLYDNWKRVNNEWVNGQDGEIDNLIIIMRAENGNNLATAYANHASFSLINNENINHANYSMIRLIINNNITTNQAHLYSIIGHEMGHHFGLNHRVGPKNREYYGGNWAIMSAYCTYFHPFEAFLLGWIDFIPIPFENDVDQSIYIPPYYPPPNTEVNYEPGTAYKIEIPNSNNYLILYNAQNNSGVIDRIIPDGNEYQNPLDEEEVEGIIITKINGNNNQIEIICNDGKSNWSGPEEFQVCDRPNQWITKRLSPNISSEGWFDLDMFTKYDENLENWNNADFRYPDPLEEVCYSTHWFGSSTRGDGNDTWKNNQFFSSFTNPSTLSYFPGLSIENINEIDIENEIFSLDINFDKYNVINSGILTSGDWYFNNDKIVEENARLIIYPGTNLFFNMDKRMVVYGEIEILGEVNFPVTFQSVEVNEQTSWDGIIINGNAEINYTNISNASTGINFTSLSSGYIKNSSIHHNRVGVGVASGDVIISNNTIDQNENIGIRANFSSPTIRQNEMHDNGNYGIFLGFGSQAKITNNNIYENGDHDQQTTTNAGITIIGSSPELYLNTLNQQNQSNYPVNNRIYNNYNKEIYIDYNSSPNLGALDEENSPLFSGGYNHFFYDEPADYKYSVYQPNGLLNQNNPRRNDIFAQWNYWHTDLTNSEQPIDIFGDQIYWEPTATSLDIFIDDAIIVAMIKEQNDEIEEALILYNEFIDTQPESDNLLTAIDGMCRCYEKLNQPEVVISRLEDLRNQSQYEKLRTIAKDHLIWSYKKANLDQDAIDLVEELIIEYNDTVLEAYYMLELALLIEESDGSLLGRNSDKKRHIDEIGVTLINEYPIDISTEIYLTIFDNPIFSDENITLIPEEYNLVPIHPNPFNPITNINYDIPEESYISISVYDLVGRKLEDLVNGTVQAGKFNTTWNAEKYSSGIYMVRMQTPYYSATQKLMLLK